MAPVPWAMTAPEKSIRQLVLDATDGMPLYKAGVTRVSCEWQHVEKKPAAQTATKTGSLITANYRARLLVDDVDVFTGAKQPVLGLNFNRTAFGSLLRA